MDIGLLNDRHSPLPFPAEGRVALTPRGVTELTSAGHTVWVERGAGERAGYPDDDFSHAGAHLVSRRAELLGRSALIVGLGWLSAEEAVRLEARTVVLSMQRLDLAPAELRRVFRERDLISISADRLTDGHGHYPIIARMSELGGALAPQIAARLCESRGEGRTGVLLTRIVGLAPAEIVIIGAGTLGLAAARGFAALGASVHLFDKDLGRLEAIAPTLPANLSTEIAHPEALDKAIRFANVLVLAVRVPGERAPLLLSDAAVRSMRPGAVLLDFSVDEGGAAATVRPIQGPEEAYLVHRVVHFTMPNSPSMVARTASQVLSQVLLPFVNLLASGAHPTAHRTFAPAVWWGEAPGIEPFRSEDDE